MLIVFKNRCISNNAATILFFVTCHCGLECLERLETSSPTSRTYLLLCFPEKHPNRLTGKIT